MKKTNRILAILLAALLLAGVMATGAMAVTLKPMADDDGNPMTGSVKITNAVAGATYTFYRVLDISGVSEDGATSNFITNDKWNAAIRTFDMEIGNFNNEPGVGAPVTVTDFPNDKAQTFAGKVVSAAETNSISADKEATAKNSESLDVGDLQFGFYVMVSSRKDVQGV